MRRAGEGTDLDQPTPKPAAGDHPAGRDRLDQRALNVVPALIADLGDAGGWRYVEFFTANIRNPHTRRAYARACSRFFAWCEDRGLTPAAIRPHDVGTYIEQLQPQSRRRRSSSSSPRSGCCSTGWSRARSCRTTRPLLCAGRSMSSRSARRRCSKPRLGASCSKSIPTETVRDLRDRALIATLTYSFARINAALKMKVEDLRPRGAGWSIRLHEKDLMGAGRPGW